MFLLDLKSVNILKQGKPSFFQDNYDMKTRSNLLVSGLCNSFLSPENKEKMSDFKESGSFLRFWVPCFKHWNVLSQDLEIRLFWPCFKETYFNSGTYGCHPRMKSFVKRNSKSSVTSVVYYCLQKNCYPPRFFSTFSSFYILFFLGHLELK